MSEFRQARPKYVPEPRPASDSWQRDVTVVLFAAAVLLAIAGLALLLNPGLPVGVR